MASPKGQKTSSVPNLVQFIKSLWEKDRKFVIQQGILLGGLVILLFFVLIPLSAKIHILNTKTKQTALDIRTAQSKIKRMPEYQKQLEMYGKEIELVEKRFFEIRDLDRLLGELSKLAANDGVIIIGSKPLNDQTLLLPKPYDTKYLSVSYELTIAGSYHEIGKFMNDIEQFEKLLLVREISIQPNTSKRTAPLQSTLQIIAFVKAPEGIK